MVSNLSSGLVLDLDMGSLQDYSGNSYDGTASGTTLTADHLNRAGRARKFGTGNDYVYNATFLDASLPDTLTISCWVMKDDAFSSASSVFEYFISKENVNGTDSIGIYYSSSDGKIKASTEANSGGVIIVGSTRTSWSAGEWVHIVYVAWGTNGSKLYINGELNDSDVSSTVKMNAGTNTNFVVGNHYDLSGLVDLIDGTVEGVKVWNREPTATEVQQLYNDTKGNYQGLFDSCVAYYDFKNDAKDIIGGNDGTLVNTPTPTTNHLGINNSAYDLESTNSEKITLGNIGNIKSVAMWVNLDSTSEKIFEGDPDAHLIYANAGTLTYPDWDNAYIDGVDTDTITASSWKLIVITSTTDVNCTDIELGLNNATYGDLVIGPTWLFSSDMSSQAKQLYDLTKTRMIYPYMKRTTLK